MITKTYSAHDAYEAQELVYQELGSHAIILTSKIIKPKWIRSLFSTVKVEILAAVDEAELKAYYLLKGQAVPEHLLKEKEYRLVGNHFKNNLVLLKHLIEAFTHLESQGAEQRLFQEAVKQPKVKQLADEEVNSGQHLLRVGQRLMDRWTHAAQRSGEDETVDQSEMIQFLITKGIAPSIAHEIVNRVNEKLGISKIPSDGVLKTAMLNVLKRDLAELIKVDGPIALNSAKSKICAFVGPSGEGKTTIIMKIALQYLNVLQKRVAIIVLDPLRIGAYEQMSALVQKFNILFTKVSTASEMEEALKFYEGYDLVLIDTPGRNPYQWQQVDELLDLLSMVEEIEIHLVLGATMKDADMIGAIRQFDRLNLNSVIFTKLDQTIADGFLVNICYKTSKAISYLSNGPHIPDDLLIADPDELARTILVQHNAQEFKAICQLANQ